EKETHQSDLQQAHEIQMHLLPRETPQLSGFQIACAWQPALTVSGDYFDVLPLGKDKVGLCIADVSGKGMAAALLMANLQGSSHAFAGDVGDTQANLIFPERKNVEIIAADRKRRLPRAGDLKAGKLGRFAGQQMHLN